jgi:hypothetical protein
MLNSYLKRTRRFGRRRGTAEPLILLLFLLCFAAVLVTVAAVQHLPVLFLLCGILAVPLQLHLLFSRASS